MSVRFDWRGEDVERRVKRGVAEGLMEFGLRSETGAKRRLQPGHGVITGTLRRSIHCATPGYSWAGDNVVPDDSTPERGGEEAEPAEVNGNLILQLGSGLEYAMAVHQGHGSFEGYHYITEAVAEQKPRLSEILKRHVEAQA